MTLFYSHRSLCLGQQHPALTVTVQVSLLGEYLSIKVLNPPPVLRATWKHCLGEAEIWFTRDSGLQK